MPHVLNFLAALSLIPFAALGMSASVTVSPPRSAKGREWKSNGDESARNGAETVIKCRCGGASGGVEDGGEGAKEGLGINNFTCPRFTPNRVCRSMNL